MSVWVYTICKDEVEMIPWFLRHYETFADRIIVYDEQSKDGTREILQRHPKVEIREWKGRGLDDEMFTHYVNTVPDEAAGRADWVMWPDVDELLYSPNIEHVLNNASEDMILARGLALIAHPNKKPIGGGIQIYDAIKTGYPQPNYDKYICWRPQIKVAHTIGRHTYPPDWPRCDGVKGMIPKLKLFHCHHVWGVEHTKRINARNMDRAVNKKFAWNYSPAHNTQEQVGTEAWVSHLIKNNLLYDVVN